MQQFIAMILITLSIIQFYVFANYNIVRALYDVNAPFIAVILLLVVGLGVGIVGVVILLAKKII